MITAEEANIYARTYELNNELEIIEQFIREQMKQGNYNILMNEVSEEAQTILDDEGYSITSKDGLINISWD